MKQVKYAPGYRNHKLTLIRIAGYRGTNLYWEVKCDCGIVKEMSTSALSRSKTCGCGKRLKEEEWIGREYGLWTILRRGEGKKTSAYWLCQCRCGTVRNVLGHSLVHSQSLSCGCKGNRKEVKIKKPKIHIPERRALRIIWANMLYSCDKRSMPLRCSDIDEELRTFETFAMIAGRNYKPGARLTRTQKDEGFYPNNMEWIYPNGDYVPFI